jgi:hypothetical protein
MSLGNQQVPDRLAVPALQQGARAAEEGKLKRKKMIFDKTDEAIDTKIQGNKINLQPFELRKRGKLLHIQPVTGR